MSISIFRQSGGSFGPRLPFAASQQSSSCLLCGQSQMECSLSSYSVSDRRGPFGAAFISARGFITPTAVSSSPFPLARPSRPRPRQGEKAGGRRADRSSHRLSRMSQHIVSWLFLTRDRFQKNRRPCRAMGRGRLSRRHRTGRRPSSAWPDARRPCRKQTKP